MVIKPGKVPDLPIDFAPPNVSHDVFPRCFRGETQDTLDTRLYALIVCLAEDVVSMFASHGTEFHIQNRENHHINKMQLYVSYSSEYIIIK